MDTNIPFSNISLLSDLVSNYLSGDEKLSDLYNKPPTIDSFETVLKEHHSINRPLLVDVLKQQNTSGNFNVNDNIERLLNDNTYTVTTGHQLCLFSGPMYFIYKIISAINLAKELKTKYPNNEFVPVYWMATEDHDKDEIDHFNLFGKQIQWKTDQTGAVGRFEIKDSEDFIAEVKASFRTEEPYLTAIINCFKSAKTLEEATRNLVNYLFEEHGVVTIDADNSELKRSFSQIMKDDLLNHTSKELITKTSDKLEDLGYKTQIFPRAINLFYLKDDLRARITLENNTYKVLDSDISFSKDELLNELDKYPERFSPNVALRPLYQESILPNLAYIGGPGETAYWLQLKAQFDYYKISYPLLIQRNSALLIRSSIEKKINKLNLNPMDLFLTADGLIKKYIKENADINFDDEIKGLEDVFELAKNKAVNIDVSLERTVIAELQKAQNAINMIKSKTIKAEKNNNDIAVKQLESIKNNLFPNNSLQERHDNILNFYNENLIPTLIDRLKPLSKGIELITI